MNNLQTELNILFDDKEKADEVLNTVVKLAKDTKKKAKETKVKEVKEKKPKEPKIRTTPLIKTSINNESKFHDKIKDICVALKAKGPIRIVLPWGNTGLLAYWFKTYCPEADVILNDTENVIGKLDSEVKEKFLNDVDIEQEDIDKYLVPYTDIETFLVLNPREFDIKVIEFLTHKFNLIVMGSTKNKNTDYIHIFNNLVSKLDPKYSPIPYSALAFATETDYILVDTVQDTTSSK